MPQIDDTLRRSTGLTDEILENVERRAFDEIPKSKEFNEAESALEALRKKEAVLETKRQAALAVGQQYASMARTVEMQRRDLGVVRDKLTLHQQAAQFNEGVEMLRTDVHHHWSGFGNALLNRDNQKRIVALMEVEFNRMAEALAVKEAELAAFGKEHGIEPGNGSAPLADAPPVK